MSIALAPAPRADYHQRFAAVYDTFYRRRNVAGEVALALELLGVSDPHGGGFRVVDFGCGTGSHALEFARRGIAVTGYDVSEAMIAEAREKAKRSHCVRAEFADGELGEFCERQRERPFDGGVSFFNVLNCLDSAGAMVQSLALLRGILAPGARMLIDVWNGAAVFVNEPMPDVRHYTDSDDPNVEMIRITIPTIDRIEQRCTLQYRVLNLNRNDGRFSEFESIHKLHFLTPTQYRHIFEISGFAILDEFSKDKPGTPISHHDWYISYLVENPK